MPFGLKNIGATYQRMITRMFEPHLRKNIEIYIDDMVVKSMAESDHVNDLENIFGILKRVLGVLVKSMLFWYWIKKVLGVHGYTPQI